MNIHPFDEVAKNAQAKIAQGWTVFQQFRCSGCGAKQTMTTENKFFTEGVCEECGETTNIKRDGCNFMAIWSKKGAGGPGVGELLADMIKGRGGNGNGA